MKCSAVSEQGSFLEQTELRLDSQILNQRGWILHSHSLCLSEKSILPFKALPCMKFSAVRGCEDSEDTTETRNTFELYELLTSLNCREGINFLGMSVLPKRGSVQDRLVKFQMKL